MRVKAADIVVGLSWGDEGKGKVTSQLAAHGEYDFVARWAGGNNAGHTVYVNKKQYKTHLIPSGVFYGIKSVIGPACVLNVESFLSELSYLASHGFDTSLVKVSPRCHIVTDEHIQKDKSTLFASLGTTAKGIAPAYSDKAARTGILAKDVLDEKYLWDEKLYGNILCEGAQGIWLDMDYGNYPYVTSSTTLPYAAPSIGFAPQKIRRIFGIAKVYDTRSGVDPLFPPELLQDEVLAAIGERGGEYGTTTGRRRFVNWLRLDMLAKAVNLSGTTDLILNKCDILKDLNEKAFGILLDSTLKVFEEDRIVEFKTFDEFTNYIETYLYNNCELLDEVTFSYSPHSI